MSPFMQKTIAHPIRFPAGKFSLLLLIRTLFCVAVAAQFAWLARASEPKLGPLIDLSDPDALVACGSNGNEKEAYVAVNPANPKNIVTAWWGGRATAIVTAVTLDGG